MHPLGEQIAIVRMGKLDKPISYTVSLDRGVGVSAVSLYGQRDSRRYPGAGNRHDRRKAAAMRRCGE